MTTFKTLFLIHFHFLFFFYLTMIPIFSSSNEITKLKTIIFLRWKEMVTMRLGSVDGINKLDNKCGSNFWVCARTPKVWPFKWKLLSSTFLTNPVVWPFKWQLLSDTFLWYILSYCKRLLQWIQVNPTKESNRFVYCTATAWGDLSKNSFGRRTSTGIGLFAFLGQCFSQIFGQIASIRETTLRNTNMVMSRYFKREKALLPVDRRQSKTS